MTTEVTQYEYDRIADRKRIDFITNVLKNQATPQSKVLDVGCGNGVISRHLGTMGYNVLGIDVSEKTIEMARSLTKTPNVKFATISAEQLVADGQKYDVIICSEVLEHLTDPSALLKTLHETLADDGKLIVTVPNGKGPRELFVTRPVLRMRKNRGFMWRTMEKVKRLFGYKGTTTQSAADNLDHIQFFSKTDLEKLSASNKFKITKFGKANFIEDVFPFSIVTRKVPVLQKIDCKVAEILPLQFTGGFFSVWEKQSGK
ncbi:methyltransferase domain-containing protein [Terrimonas sp. NA20]|uniref:Methyltransferase domain-containing protein n=1 Tax=Terrimonas ginsenosidimutans TaxID=2908004 RepID=A0ABS9KX13_9BACT|nr:methyltransferase domain-containing protein [Terrimonas ginsenosidimutans]MCG2616853.1 methyltransferase domain-containing protein [Terrimonas ginsenosidimutans]